MRYFVIPLLLLMFVVVYPHAEYAWDCPTAMSNPEANDSCTWVKSQFYGAMSVLSLTEYGFPADKVFFVEAHNPDAYEYNSIIPMLTLTVVIAVAEWRLSGRRAKRLDERTAESLR